MFSIVSPSRGAGGVRRIPGRAGAEPSRGRAEPIRAGPGRAEPSRAEPGRAEPSRFEPIRAGPGRSRCEPGRARPGRAQAQTFGGAGAFFFTKEVHRLLISSGHMVA